MKHKVVFDTNAIRSENSIQTFLGGRSELEQFLKIAELIIPDIVLEEIKVQKKKHLLKKKDSFLINPFTSLLGLKKRKIKEYDIDEKVLQLVEGETIPYTVISLTKNKEMILEQMKTFSLNNIPPFEKTSDKGFKDTYIYFTILEYLESCGDEVIYLVTNDGMLSQSFGLNRQISVVRGYDEFEKSTNSYFLEEYFIGRLKEQVDPRISKDCIKETWINMTGIWTIKIVCEEKTYFVEVDYSSREIIDSTDYNFTDGISSLINSRSFERTHSQIEIIRDYTQYFSDQEIKDLIQSAITNDQIYSIAEDEDVMEFFLLLFKNKGQIVDEEIRDKFTYYFNIKP